MVSFHLGDLIGHQHPNTQKTLKVGIVIEKTSSFCTIKWIWYDKKYYMEDFGEAFKALNREFMLDTSRHDVHDNAIFFQVLNSSKSS
jgi:hypothetical protein|tara:strand:+ start:278 stop:538 length:261 start_codon:yes stop_codon:yes gene_type:complete